MPFYLNAIVSADRANNCYQVAVIWDLDDPNTLVCQTNAGSMPTGHQCDPDKVYISDAEVDETLFSMGFRVLGHSASGRITVIRNSDHAFFDPVTREWYTSDPHGKGDR